jgi:outer membrane protein TolC
MRPAAIFALMVVCIKATGDELAPGVDQLVSTLSTQHPEAMAAQSRTQQAEGRRSVADAAFDLRVAQTTDIRSSGYYDGRVADQRMVQPLKPLNAEVFGAYRISDGSFPVYEQEYQTLDDGEVSLGVKISLLQNRDTDPRRLELENSAWHYQEAASRQLLDVNKLVYRGVSAWLNWYQSTLKRAVVAELLALTENRLEAIQQRVDSGDLASITLTEFRTTLLQRTVLLQEADRVEAQARDRLAYFMVGNDAEGYSVSGLLEVPPDIGWPYSIALGEGVIDWSDQINDHPGLLALEAKAQQLEVDQRLARNELLPELDLEMKIAQDFGSGPDSLDGTDSIIALSFEVPIGVRAAKARAAIAAAATREVDYQYQVVSAQIQRDLEVSLTALRFNQQILATSQNQESLALKLLAQEQIRFNEGESDQFILISREKSALEAQIKTIDATIDKLRNELLIHATLARLAA